MTGFAAPQQGAYGADGYEGIAAQIAARDPSAYGYFANARARSMAGNEAYREDLLNTLMAQREASFLDASDKRTGRQIDAMGQVRQGLDPRIVTGATNLLNGVSSGVINSTAENNLANQLAGRYKDLFPGMASMRDAGAELSSEAMAGAAAGRYVQPGDFTLREPASVRSASMRADGEGAPKVFYEPGFNGAPDSIRVVGSNPEAVMRTGQQLKGNAAAAGTAGTDWPTGFKPAPQNAETQRLINELAKKYPEATGNIAIGPNGKLWMKDRNDKLRPIE
jgi:hypothetical protein